MGNGEDRRANASRDYRRSRTAAPFSAFSALPRSTIIFLLTPRHARA
jgi:hypothetical protein